MTELASKYSPAEVEGKWYQYWLDNKLFSSKPDGREPFALAQHNRPAGERQHEAHPRSQQKQYSNVIHQPF